MYARWHGLQGSRLCHHPPSKADAVNHIVDRHRCRRFDTAHIPVPPTISISVPTISFGCVPAIS
jgi:hypothetical protein